MKKKNVTQIASAALASKSKGFVIPNGRVSGQAIPKITGCRPTGSCVLVELITLQEQQGTSLYMPEDSKEEGECPQAYILDIGPKVPADIGFKVGDRVMLQGVGANPVPKFREGRKMNLVEPHIIRAVLTEAE